jgi:hypothetical protein
MLLHHYSHNPQFCWSIFVHCHNFSLRKRAFKAQLARAEEQAHPSQSVTGRQIAGEGVWEALDEHKEIFDYEHKETRDEDNTC